MNPHLPRTIWETMASEDPDPSLPKYDDLTEAERDAYDHGVLAAADWAFVNTVRRHRRDTPVV